MSEIIATDGKRPSVGHAGADARFPGPGDAELIERSAKSVMEACFALTEADLRTDGLAAAIDRAERVIEMADAIRANLEDAMARATHDDVALHLASVVAAFPNSRADEYFGKLLVADVGALEPSRGAIEAACRHLRRRDCKFLPAISEVCKAVEDAEWMFRTASEMLEVLPSRVAAAKKKLAVRADEYRRGLEIEARRRSLRLATTSTPAAAVAGNCKGE
jgi:hypothetical protein